LWITCSAGRWPRFSEGNGRSWLCVSDRDGADGGELVGHAEHLAECGLIRSKPGGHTQMGFVVPDIRAEIKQLRSKGVVFEEYDLPALKTVDGIVDRGELKVAWFKDSEGNMLGLAETTQEGLSR
jgi:hypothetical protein